MRTLLVVCLLALPAFGHIKLTSPGNFQVTGTYGDPNKDEPCGGAGTATGVITEVMAGSQLTVRWTEPIPHPGHFRIGIARTEADFVTPTPVVTMNNCVSAPIQSPVAYPTLVDGLFPHTSTQGPYQTTVTVPMMSCANCTLQVMQFMSAHAPGCFYFQCAKLRIVMPDAGQPMVDAGVDAGIDAGIDAGVDAGTSQDAGVDAGSGAGGGGGGGPGTCGPSSCAGCCVANRCEPGTSNAACGVGGNICNSCSGDTLCEDNVCLPPRGCGCTSAPGLFALALGLWVMRRSKGARTKTVNSEP